MRLDVEIAQRFGMTVDLGAVVGGLFLSFDAITAIHVPVFAGADENELADIAGQIQDFVIEDQGVAWPSCPLHTHPLWAELVDGVATWVCSTERGVRYPIGKLQEHKN